MAIIKQFDKRSGMWVTNRKLKGELEEYKAKKALEKKMKTTVIFDPRERNEWKYYRGMAKLIGHFTVAELRMSMTLKIYQGIRIFGRFCLLQIFLKIKMGIAKWQLIIISLVTWPKILKKEKKPKQLSLRENGISIMNLWIS